MGLDNTLWLAGILTEAVVVGLLAYRRVWRLLPLFCIYCLWDLLSNTGGFLALQFSPNSYNPITYFFQASIDSVLMFGVLVELSWSVLRPIRQSLSRFTPVIMAAALLAIGAAIWPFSMLPGLSGQLSLVRLVGHVQQTVAVLRIFFFLGLAGCSQLLSIGLRDRELQVATGLGFYSLVSLGTAMLSAHQSTVVQYQHLNRLVIGSFLCSLLYWAFAFVQKEAQRREFTPQMQNLLLAVAGTARANRAALRDSEITDAKSRRRR